MNALILTGGLGTRLRPLTLATPKPLLPIVNRPFLSYPIALLRKEGVDTVLLCTAGSVKPYQNLIRKEKNLGSKLFLSQENKELGTAGAIKKAEKFITHFPVFVLNGDVLTNLNLSAMLQFHQKMKSHATIALIQMLDPSAYGLVEINANGRILRFIEKPKNIAKSKNPAWINAGIYILEKEIFSLIPENKKCSIEREIFPLCLRKGLVFYGFKMSRGSFWIDIGTPEKYLQANELVLKNGWKRFGLNGKPGRIGEASTIGKNSFIGKDVVIGRKCRIGNHSQLRRAVLLDDVKVEDFVELENCIIGSGSSIGHHTKIKGGAVIGDRSAFTPYTTIIQ